MRKRSPYLHAAGFTLLEAIVTLAIVALIATLLVQSLSHTLSLRERLLRHQASARVAALQEQWFRESVSSAMADLPDGLGVLHGAADSVELVTADPLGVRSLQRVRWWLGAGPDGNALHYGDGQWSELTVIEGPLRDAAFSYLDAAGTWHARWPPDRQQDEVLPRLLRLEADTVASGRLVWLVPMLADPRPAEFLRPEDVLDGF